MGKPKDPLAAKRKERKLQDAGMREILRQENLKLLAEASAAATHEAITRHYYNEKKKKLRKKGPKQA